MASDASIYSNMIAPGPSMLDQASKFNALDTSYQTNALQRQAMQQQNQLHQMSIDRNNKLMGVYSQSTPDTVEQNLYKGGFGPEAEAYGKTHAGILKDTAEAGKFNAQANGDQLATHIKTLDYMSQQWGALSQKPDLSFADVVSAAQKNIDSGIAQPSQVVPLLQQMKDMPPDQLRGQLQTMLKQSLSAKEQLELSAAKLTEVKNGQTNSLVDTNSQSPTYVGTTGKPVSTMAVSVSPDAQLAANTSTSNNRANIAKDLTVAGVGANGQPNADTQSMVDAIGQYKVAPPNGMALRNPRMQAILAQVTQKYPDFDATEYGARSQAARSFSTGKDGQAIQSANTALNHLDTLAQLADAQKNGNSQLFNQLANKLATATGQPAPTNLQGAVTMVGPEISKAVVGAGGTGGDREKVDSALQSLVKGSPSQAAGQVATMKDLFGGRLTEAARTYERTTGRKDFAPTFLSPAAQQVFQARSGRASAPSKAANGATVSNW